MRPPEAAAEIIRRIGGNFVPGKLGFVSTLCAARVPEEKVAHFAEVVNRHPGVTHNYRRENAFNVWFTFIAPSMADIDAKLKEIVAETGVTEILNLPATKVFKIRAQFDGVEKRRRPCPACAAFWIIAVSAIGRVRPVSAARALGFFTTLNLTPYE